MIIALGTIAFVQVLSLVINLVRFAEEEKYFSVATMYMHNSDHSMQVLNKQREMIADLEHSIEHMKKMVGSKTPSFILSSEGLEFFDKDTKELKPIVTKK